VNWRRSVDGPLATGLAPTRTGFANHKSRFSRLPGVSGTIRAMGNGDVLRSKVRGLAVLLVLFAGACSSSSPMTTGSGGHGGGAAGTDGGMGGVGGADGSQIVDTSSEASPGNDGGGDTAGKETSGRDAGTSDASTGGTDANSDGDAGGTDAGTGSDAGGTDTGGTDAFASNEAGPYGDASSDFDAASLCTGSLNSPLATITNDTTGTLPAPATFTGGTLTSGMYYLNAVTHYSANTQYGGANQESWLVDVNAKTVRIALPTGMVGVIYSNSDVHTLHAVVVCNTTQSSYATFDWYYTSGANLVINMIGLPDVLTFSVP
jgi:hypothetical protein